MSRKIRRRAVPRVFLIFVLLVTSLSTQVTRAAEAVRRPNIVVILVDDLRWDELACTGHPFVRTPSIDLAPTLIELAGAKSKHKMDGRSLMPLLKGARPSDWRTSFLVEYNTDTVFPRVRNMGYRAVRTERWKLIRYNDLDGMDELYDLKNDPYEMVNLIDRPPSKATVDTLQAELERLLNETP